MPAPEALAGEEYGGAWVPTKDRQGLEDREDPRNRDSISEAAAKKTEELRARMDKATTDQERQVVELDLRRAIFRISATFTNEDAALVRSVLEPDPAQQLLGLCLAKFGATRIEEPETPA